MLSGFPPECCPASERNGVRLPPEYADSDALVRSEAISMLMELGRQLTDEEIKKILVPPQEQPMPGLLGLRGLAGSDRGGEELFEQYQLDVLKKLSESELEKRARASLIYDDAAYFALMEKCFRNRADELRRDVDDRFSAYFKERIKRMEAAFGDNVASQNLIKKTKELEEFLRKKLTRRGLDVLCVAQKPEDLQRIRANLRDGYAGASKLDALYLGRHGTWSDIPVLASAEGPRLGATLLMMSGDQEFKIEVAKAITSIAKKHSVTDLLTLEMPAAILKQTIELCAESRFAKLSQDVLLTLLNHESEGVRKAAAIMAVRSLPAKHIKSILREYIGSDKYRYYNVIHWLDLGVSMRRDDARKVARAASS
jgi:hypothetical protein